MKLRLREIIDSHTGVDVASCDDTSDLWQAGMRSKEAVRIMLAIEDELGIEFTPEDLNVNTFASIASIAAVVEDLVAQGVGA